MSEAGFAKVNLGVDDSGEEVESAQVEFLGGGGSVAKQVLTDGLNPTSLNGDIGFDGAKMSGVVGIWDKGRGSAQQQVIVCHASGLPWGEGFGPGVGGEV